MCRRAGFMDNGGLLLSELPGYCCHERMYTVYEVIARVMMPRITVSHLDGMRLSLSAGLSTTCHRITKMNNP
jgi:hypothetical protein